MKTFIIFLSLIPSWALCQWNQNQSFKIQPFVFLPADHSYVWRFDSSNVSYYFSAEDQKNYMIDSLVYKSHLADSLCKDITILSFQAQKYFELLQEAYLELRRLKSDSLADKLQFITVARRFRICKW